jgi:hypothetical protein
VGELGSRITDWIWRYAIALPESVFGALGGIGLYALAAQWVVAARRRETYCRRCEHVLRDLTDPMCPQCREAL